MLTLSTLSDAFYILKSSLFSQYTFMAEYVENYREGVLTPLERLRDRHKNLGIRLQNDFKRNEKVFQEAIEKLEKVVFS